MNSRTLVLLLPVLPVVHVDCPGKDELRWTILLINILPRPRGDLCLRRYKSEIDLKAKYARSERTKGVLRSSLFV
jgi:hypothetical protein